jgi:hypothetical protein
VSVPVSGVATLTPMMEAATTAPATTVIGGPVHLRAVVDLPPGERATRFPNGIRPATEVDAGPDHPNGHRPFARMSVAVHPERHRHVSRNMLCHKDF